MYVWTDRKMAKDHYFLLRYGPSCVASYLVCTHILLPTYYKNNYFLDVGFIIHCLIGPLGSLLEPAKRINEYSIFVFPRVIEGFYDLFKVFVRSF